MGLLDMVTEKERALIMNQIKNYSLSDGGYADMNNWDFNRVFREWGWAKGQYLYHIFKAATGEEALILRKQVEFAKDSDEIAEELDCMAYPSCFNDIIDVFNNLARYTDPFDRDRGSAYLEKQVPECLRQVSSDYAYDMRRAILQLTSTTTLACNIYTGRTVEIPIPNGKKLKINHGSKAVKMLGKLVEAFGFDKAEFESYRISHSQVLNQKKLKGTLCLSIHPLDYITMSDNDSGWESCMSWENQGCYRQGTVEMMNSECVVVAYLEAEKPMEVTEDLSWNNKKWRELYIVTPDIVTNVKGYPYCNSNLTTEVLNWLRELIQKSGLKQFSDYDNKIYHHGGEEEFDELLRDRGITFRFRTNLMYNDFGHSYQYCLVRSSLPNNSRREINYSGASECMLCGELDPDFVNNSEASNLVCQNCDNVKVCACCGQPVYDDDYYVWINDEPVCVSCSEDYYVYDAVNAEMINKDDAIEIRICNAEHDEYADNYDLILITNRDVDPASLCTKGEFIKKTTSRLWISKTRYYIEAGTWTQEFLDALAYNLGVSDEKEVYNALSRSDWSPM